MPPQREYHEADDRSEESEDEEVEEGPRSARDRKREALFPAISAIASALGGFEEFIENGEIVLRYSLGDKVVACLKDLKRFWRLDEKDSDRTVARIFFEVGILKNDLIPILTSTIGTSEKGDRIALACVELMGAMTWPIDVAEELRDAKILDELKKSTDYTSLIWAQLAYKATILRTGALASIFQVMSPSLTKTRRERTTKDENVISLVLHTFRNLAALKDRVTASHSADAIEQATLQSELIKQMSSEYIFELLISIAHNADSSEFADWNMVVLDIFHLIFRCVKPADLMIPESKVDENRLQNLLNLESKAKLTETRKGTTRHSRFGTTVALQSGGNQYILHKQSTLSLGPEATLDKIKRSKAKVVRQDNDLQPPSHLRPDAIKCLYDVAISFIDSAFNPFFASVLKDIRMERLKVKEKDTTRFLFLSRFFLEFFLLVNQDEKKRGVDPLSEEAHGFELIAEMTEPQSIAFVTTRMKNAMEEKDQQWTELHAGVDCFIQMLLVIDALAASGVEDNIDVAEILQNKLYYEAETLDMVVQVIIKYKKQSLKYLDSVIHLAYVLLRMLEKYSKSKAYMYVRKKKSGRKKKAKKSNEDEEDGLGMGDDEEEEVERGTLNYGEHAFEFSKFEQQFAEEAVLATCMIHLQGYKSYTDPEQMKRIVGLMHRQAVKTKSEALFFKPTVLQQFQTILADENFFAMKGSASADLKQLIQYVLKKFVKAARANPFLLVEIFFPKTKQQLGKLRDGVDDPYASSEDDTYFKSTIAEVEVQAGFSLSQQIGIAVACLVDADQLALVELIQAQLYLAALARKAVVLTADGDSNDAMDDDSESEEAIRRKASRLKGPSKEAIDLFVPHVVDIGNEEERKSASGNAHLKLLMRLLKWESTPVPESLELVWSIPSTMLPSELDGNIKVIEGFLLDPVDPNGKSARDLLQKKRKVTVRKRRILTPDSENSDGDVVARPKQSKKRKEEVTAYRSAQFIDDSDDEEDEERDKIFFAAEAALRAKLAVGSVSTVAVGQGKKKSKKAPKATTSKTKTKKGKNGMRIQEKEKAVPKDWTNDGLSDVSDGEEFNLVREAAAAMKAAKGKGKSSTESDKTDASSSEVEGGDSLPTTRKRGSLSVTEVQSEAEEVAGVKKRRVVMDSDDDE